MDKREMMTSWHGSGRPHVVTWSGRSEKSLLGTAKGRRNVPAFRPFDLLSAPNQSLVILENADQQLGVESVIGAQRDFLRYIDFDVLYFQFAGSTKLETEYGAYETKPGEVILIPEGIAHRSTGTRDSLRFFIKLNDPIQEMHDAQRHTGHTEFDVIRHGGPTWTIAPENAQAPKVRVVERMITWGEAPEEVTLVERDYDELVGVSSTSRREAASGIKHFRLFDVFDYATGTGGGPGPKVAWSKHFMAEVYNTQGDQHAFHRALRSEEIGLQFRGFGINQSEFDARLETPPGLAAVLPLGISHRVVECDDQFLRVVFYTDTRWKVTADVTKHAFDSRFEVKTTVIKPAAWQASAAE